MKVRLWGTRGSIPVPGRDTMVYGGNTTCIEVRLNDGSILIFDAGTGIRKLGLSLMRENNHRELNLVLTHSHWDHIQGFPFFEPANDPYVHINILGCPGTYFKLRKILTDQMEFKYFPLNFNALKARMVFKEVSNGSSYIGNAKLSFIELNHPGTAYGFKLVDQTKSFVLLTDNELFPPNSVRTRWEQFVEFCHGVDLLIHDAMWSDPEIKTKKGWGHSSMEQVIDLARAAQVKQALLFHHLPERTDLELESMFQDTLQTKQCQADTILYRLAREGDIFEL